MGGQTIHVPSLADDPCADMLFEAPSLFNINKIINFNFIKISFLPLRPN
jgi:hypothetical protein